MITKKQIAIIAHSMRRGKYAGQDADKVYKLLCDQKRNGRPVDISTAIKELILVIRNLANEVIEPGRNSARLGIKIATATKALDRPRRCPWKTLDV